MHLVHKVNVTLLKLNVTAFEGKVSQLLIFKMQESRPLDLGNGEGEKSLSSYKREPRVVCKTRRKAFSRVSILAELIFRER